MSRIPRFPKLPLIRNRYFFIADLVLIPMAVGGSFLLRLDADGLGPYVFTILVFAALAGSVKPVVFLVSIAVIGAMLGQMT